jgi:hypothetical protein
VLRLAFRPYLALLLLLLLVRTLLPEAWVLALHSHDHTTDTEVAATHRPAGKQLISPQHTHCRTEQFYNTPFAAAFPIRMPQPRLRSHYRLLAVPAQVASLAAVLRSTALRGPPLA